MTMSSWKHLGCVAAALLPIMLDGCCENPNSMTGRSFSSSRVANAPPQPITPESFRIAANDPAHR